jgi:hypothetical protein
LDAAAKSATGRQAAGVLVDKVVNSGQHDSSHPVGLDPHDIAGGESSSAKGRRWDRDLVFGGDPAAPGSFLYVLTHM